MSNIPSDSSAEEVIDPVFPAASPSASSSEDHCKVCNGTEENRLVGVGLGLRIVDEEVDWVQCDKCDSWYHLLCLEIDDPEDIVDEWVCPECTNVTL